MSAKFFGEIHIYHLQYIHDSDVYLVYRITQISMTRE